MRELLFTLIATRAEYRHARACRKSLVGAMRRHLAAYDGAALLADGAELPPRAVALIAERQGAAADLADFCARCGRCDETKIFR